MEQKTKDKMWRDEEFHTGDLVVTIVVDPQQYLRLRTRCKAWMTEYTYYDLNSVVTTARDRK